jgi:hypothetical protein
MGKKMDVIESPKGWATKQWTWVPIFMTISG